MTDVYGTAMKRLLLFAVAALICHALLIQSATAGDQYAAIAWSQSTGSYAAAYGYAGLTTAKNRAVERCKGDDAQVVGWVRNGWIALALGDKAGIYGQAWGSTADIAQASALAACSQRTTGCYIAITVFSGR